MINNLEELNLVEKIKKEKFISLDIKEKYFQRKNFKEIRNWLENHNIDRHIPIEIKSAGAVILITMPNNVNKVLLQIRGTEKNRIGVFGGAIENNEEPIDAAIREIKEETGIETQKEQFEFLDINEHDLEYENGDKVHYIATVYLLKFNNYPKIQLDIESNGIIAISKDNFKNYTGIKNPWTLQIHPCWERTIIKAFEKNK